MGFASFRNLVSTSICLIAFEVFNFYIAYYFISTGRRLKKILTLVVFGEFNSIKCVVGND